MNKPKKIKDGKNRESEAIEIYEHPFKSGEKIVVWQDNRGLITKHKRLWYMKEGEEEGKKEDWMPVPGKDTKEKILAYICEIYTSK